MRSMLTEGGAPGRRPCAGRDNRPVHLLIPFAAPLAGAGRQALASLALPRLRTLLSRLAEVERDEADEWCLSPPHERALARALGWQGGSGLLPWAARQAAADGIDVGELAWGQITPVHWHLGTDQVSLLDPAQLVLDETSSRALYDAVLPLFTDEGYAMRWGAPLRWYAAHESLAALPCASLDRVIGRNVDSWLGSDPAAPAPAPPAERVADGLAHAPLERRARGTRTAAVNSFWLSGCGVLQRGSAEPPQVDERLRGPALNDDWAAWVKAWETLDAGPLAAALARLQQGAGLRLTLCGERCSITFGAAAGGWCGACVPLWSPPSVPDILEPL